MLKNYFPLFFCSMNPKVMDGEKQHTSFFSLNGPCFSQAICWPRASLNSVYKLAIKFISAPLFPNLNNHIFKPHKLKFKFKHYIKCFYIS